MKRLLQSLTSVLVAMSFMVGGAAALSCDVSNTGPGSTNNCTSEQTNSSTIECNNNVNLTNDSDQGSTSGSADNSNNTNSGSANSGSTNNTNSTSSDINASCGPAVTTSQVTPSQPAGGQGAAAQPVAVSSPVKPASLPNTGSNDLLTATGLTAAVLGSVVVLTRIGVSAFSSLRRS